MPLPILDATSFEPTGAVLPLDTYFNPTVNTNYRVHGSDIAHDGCLKISTYIKIAKALLNDNTAGDLLKYAAGQYGSQDNVNTRAAYKAIYRSLPDDCKWLALNTTIHLERTSNGGHRWKVYFRKIHHISYSECTMDHLQLFLNVTANPDGTFAPTAEQEAAFKTILVDQNILSIAQTYYDKADEKITYSDSQINSFICVVYRFANNQGMFYPEGERETCPVYWDWTTPARIAQYLGEEYNMSFKVALSGVRINFRIRPQPGSRNHLKRVLSYGTNVLDHLPYTIKGPKEVKEPLYGVELEACSDYTPSQVIDAQKDLFFILKHDSSISGRGDQKYEMVSVPASLRAHKRLWAEFFEKVDYVAFDTSKDTGNGMHVHVDRTAFTMSHLNRFTWFFTSPSHMDFMFAVSERPSMNNLQQWAPMPSYNQPTRLKAAQQAINYASSLRGTIHYKSDKTVEIRMFKGIVSYATIIKNLEFVDSVFHYTMHTQLSQLSIKGYLAWLSITPANKYQMLKAFLAELKIANIIASSEVHDYLWKEQREHLIIEKLNKAPFKVTNAHITALNKKRKKRTFILKNGKVHCISTSGGLLAKLDKSAQQKQTRGAASFSMTDYAA